jgi:hypothetical protein
VEGLLYYLYGPGRHAEHTDLHIVAGWRRPAELEPPLRENGRRDFRRLNGLLLQPHDALGPRGLDRPVWHCSVGAAPEDRVLSDAEWTQVAGDIMDRTGLAPVGQDDDAVRWVAIRHASVTTSTSWQCWRARTAGGPGSGTTSTGSARPAERRRAASDCGAPRRGTAPRPGRRPGRSRRRPAAAASRSPRGSRSGARPARLRPARPVNGSSSAAWTMPGDTTSAGTPVWFGGGKLAADLTLPKLRQRWDPAATADREPLTSAEREAIWERAARTAADAAGQIRRLAGADPDAAADAAWAASDTLHIAASALRSRDIRQAADSFDRAARAPYGRIPPRTPAGNSLRRAARLLSSAAFVSGDPAPTQILLIIRLAALVESIADLRAAQQHAAQAAAARRAAEHLCTAAGSSTRRPPTKRATARTAADLAGLGFSTPSRSPQASPARLIGSHRHAPARPPGRRRVHVRLVSGDRAGNVREHMGSQPTMRSRASRQSRCPSGHASRRLCRARSGSEPLC